MPPTHTTTTLPLASLALYLHIIYIYKQTFLYTILHNISYIVSFPFLSFPYITSFTLLPFRSLRSLHYSHSITSLFLTSLYNYHHSTSLTRYIITLSELLCYLVPPHSLTSSARSVDTFSRELSP